MDTCYANFIYMILVPDSDIDYSVVLGISSRQIVTTVVLLIVVFFVILAIVKFARLWLQAYLSKADVKLSELIGMWLRKVDAQTIVLNKITAIKAGLKLSTRDLESHYLAGGNVPNVVNALIEAKKANTELSFQTASAIDLTGQDILDTVQTNVHPELQEIIGSVGTVISPLRPVGICNFSGQRLECVAESGYVDKGKKVKVIKIESTQLTVRTIEDVS